jgi:hypothetical protein
MYDWLKTQPKGDRLGDLQLANIQKMAGMPGMLGLMGKAMLSKAQQSLKLKGK